MSDIPAETQAGRPLYRMERMISSATVAWVVILTTYAIFQNQELSHTSLYFLKIILALSGGVMLATLPGFFDIGYSLSGFSVRAAGGAAAFVFIYTQSPHVPLLKQARPIPSPSEQMVEDTASIEETNTFAHMNSSSPFLLDLSPNMTSSASWLGRKDYKANGMPLPARREAALAPNSDFLAAIRTQDRSDRETALKPQSGIYRSVISTTGPAPPAPSPDTKLNLNFTWGDFINDVGSLADGFFAGSDSRNADYLDLNLDELETINALDIPEGLSDMPGAESFAGPPDCISVCRGRRGAPQGKAFGTGEGSVWSIGSLPGDGGVELGLGIIPPGGGGAGNGPASAPGLSGGAPPGKALGHQKRKK